MKNIQPPIFAIDFEGSRKIGVVEYGVVEILDLQIVDARTHICAPKCKIPQRDAEFFGIDNATAASQPPFDDYMQDFCKMRSRGIFMAHNAAVEDSLLRDTLPSPAIVKNFATNNDTREWAPWLDTCALVKNIFPQIDSAKLSEVIEILRLKERLDSCAKKYCPAHRMKWHCALYDAIASAQILIYICQQDGFEDVDLQWLAKYSGIRDIGQGTLF